MRLLNTETRLFEEFMDDNAIPPYAILSHTWGSQEVSYREMCELQTSSINVSTCEGYRKINRAREIAASQKYRYIWIDTCCIDKTSSAELTEAINSMYDWYQNAMVCYVYLVDLKTTSVTDHNISNGSDNHETVTTQLQSPAFHYKKRNELGECRWFSRGWTLQELIAPENIIFYDADWTSIGTKSSLADELSAITKISQAILLHEEPLSSVCVARKMSWASKRETTRTEDMAYCLLGIFGVNLPFIYGEKHRAFRRLQKAILESESSDLSIYAWKRSSPTIHQPKTKRSPREYCGVLALSPSEFAESGRFVKKVVSQRVNEMQPGNCGIKVDMQFLIQMMTESGGYRYLLPLDCYSEDNPTAILCARLRKYKSKRFVRENPTKIEEITTPLLAPIVTGRRYLLPDTPPAHGNGRLQTSGGGQQFDFIGQSRVHAIQLNLAPDMWLHRMDVWPGDRFDGEDRAFYLNEENSELDSCMIRLRGGVLASTEPERVDFEVMFCAVGWSSSPSGTLSKGGGLTGPHEPLLQCAVMDYREYAGAFSEFRFDARAWDFHRVYFLERLVYHKMPRRSSIIMEVNGFSGTSADQPGSLVPRWVRVRFKVVPAKDPNVCRNEFWRVEYDMEYSNDKEKLEQGTEMKDPGFLDWEVKSHQRNRIDMLKKK